MWAKNKHSQRTQFQREKLTRSKTSRNTRRAHSLLFVCHAPKIQQKCACTNNGQRAAAENLNQRLDGVNATWFALWENTGRRSRKNWRGGRARDRETREWCSHAIKGRKKRRGRTEWMEGCVCLSECGADAGVHGTATNPCRKVECAAKRTRHATAPLEKAAQWMKWIDSQPGTNFSPGLCGLTDFYALCPTVGVSGHNSCVAWLFMLLRRSCVVIWNLLITSNLNV